MNPNEVKSFIQECFFIVQMARCPDEPFKRPVSQSLVIMDVRMKGQKIGESSVVWKLIFWAKVQELGESPVVY